MNTVQDAALSVLTVADPRDKCAAAHAAHQALSDGKLKIGAAPTRWPDRPARPDNPKLVTPGNVPRRRLTSAKGRAALMHAVAHIEFNAIDLAFDMAGRFCTDSRLTGPHQAAFIADWFKVGDDEARHFQMINNRLSTLDTQYGALPAHDGLWRAAQDTAYDLAARLALAPMVLEARGLDVTPGMIEKLQSAKDFASADILKIIYQEEHQHVAAGSYWFNHVCAQSHLDPVKEFKTYINKHFIGGLKPPFNAQARDSCGIKEEFYLDLVHSS